MNDIMLNILTVVGSILLLDLVLSGDNALVIGAAAAGFQKPQRWLIIALGAGVAIILRLIFALLATQLLPFAFLQILSGLLLLLIAVHLLATRKETSAAAGATPVPVSTAREGTSEATSPGIGKETAVLSTTSFIAAVLTMLVADVILSLNNVLTLGTLAGDNGVVLFVGILLSVILLMPCSALVVKLIGAFPWLLDGAALLLAWTGAYIVLNGRSLGPLLDRYPWMQLVIPSAAFAIVLLADVFLRMRQGQHVETNQLE